MPYFPTEEDWTQVMLPPKSAPYCKSMEQPPTDYRPTLHQSNLPFTPTTRLHPDGFELNPSTPRMGNRKPPTRNSKTNPTRIALNPNRPNNTYPPHPESLAPFLSLKQPQPTDPHLL
ncbi:hypothetical protein F4604DRAFT_1927871 [Suillus subluteus]|nr:hypothetical protein F4604DRAFT_1927871 [Suillus subluteus]